MSFLKEYYREYMLDWPKLRPSLTANIFKVVGSDRDIVMISRVATGKEEKELDDAQLERSVKHLITQRHWSPFEFQHLYINVEAPIYVLRQLMRSPRPFMEKSRRYTSDDPRYDESVADIKCVLDAGIAYKGSLAKGKKPEDCRKILPVATYSKVFWNPNLRDLLHFIRLRLDDHAQLEIRNLAQELFNQLTEYFPLTMKYFTQYELGEFSFSTEDLYYIIHQIEEVYTLHEESIDKKGKRIIKNAKRRISMVERVLAGVSPEVRDSTEDSTGTEVSPTNGSEVP